MGSTSDLPVMEKAAQLLNDMHVPFEMNALSAHRTPEAVEEFAKNARNRGIKVIIAAAGMAAALPGVIAANTTLPVIGVPVKGSVLDGVDALYSIIQMPPGIPVATVAINGAMNAAILAIQMLALSDEKLAEAFAAYKEGLKKKIVKAKKTRELAVCGLAKGMKLQSDAKEAFQNMRDDAADLCYDAKVEAGIEKAPVEETTDENSEEME